MSEALPRVAFFGSPDFAVPVLDAVRAHFPVVLVVAQPDKPVGRGLKLSAPPVAAHAAALGLPLAQPPRLKNNEDFAARLAASEADVAVTCAYGKILPASLLAVPRFGFLNTHTSLLPRYRGAAPIQWALIRGETTTGTTIMQTDPGMDTGPVLLQEALSIAPNWTAPELASALQAQAARLIVQALTTLKTLTPQPQNEAEATHAPMLSKADGDVVWHDSAQAIYNRYRGVYAWPQTSSTLAGRRVKLGALRPLPGHTGGQPGEVVAVSREGVTVACGEGALELLTVQPESKKPMPAPDWWRGTGQKLGARFE
ncbi:methionyl-tRNA formyltransferase [Deinococcus sp. KNUC1210]|uniref:methionyl-tRNA formyltransferase n=1 Tax=Deinococcus sp. KNUC1210 TaxID=2917691 RepID=UPI001EF09C69|nr:methionyl-tRNA formyltransferase [Deinococcus sp. KNUC1210]ULH16388.1 methionyl-tRNA formyltransferase [Deinococcus sp. KNUC1210]